MNPLNAVQTNRAFEANFARIFGAPSLETQMIDINALYCEEAPLVRFSQNQAVVILAVDPRTFRIGVLRERVYGPSRWGVQLEVAAMVRGPALAVWLQSQVSNIAALNLSVPSRMTELRLAEMQRGLSAVETADPTPQDGWLEDVVMGDERGFQIPGVGAITAATTDRQIDELVARASDGSDPSHLRDEFNFMRLAHRNGDTTVVPATDSDAADPEVENEQP